MSTALGPAQSLRNPLRPLPSLRHEGIIIVRHPGFDVQFFSIPCFPQPPPLGAHLGLVLDACEIIANNQPGFLGTSKDRNSKISSNDRDLTLPPGNYYYHLIETSIPKYPIVTEFDAWTPPSELPEHWQNVSITSSERSSGTSFDLAETTWSIVSRMVKNADVYCAMTGASSRLSACHLVPRASVHWFMEHSVFEHFGYPIANIDDPDNLITLRADLNGLGIDKGHFVFVPIQGALTVYFITKGLPDLAEIFHCRRIYLPARTPRECLYYRFAWSIFQSIKHLLPKLSTVIHIPVPNGILERRKQSAERKGKVGRNHALVIDDDDHQPPMLDDVEMEETVNNASLLSHFDDDDDEHPPDLCVLYTPEFIPALAAEDERIKRQVGHTLDESNIHLLSDRDVRHNWYPGFSDVLRRKQEYLLKNPQVRGTNEAVIGRINDGYESDRWGWADGEESESEEKEEEESQRVIVHI